MIRLRRQLFMGNGEHSLAQMGHSWWNPATSDLP